MIERVINEKEPEVTLETISEEIRSFFKMENQSVFEIGTRLLHVKTNNLTHGKFTEWVTSIGIDKYEASKYIKVQKKLAKLDICTTLNKRILFELLSVENVEEFVNQEHTIPSTGEVKTIDGMTVAELKEIKRGDKEPNQSKDYVTTVSQRLKNLIKPLKQILNDENLSAMVQIGDLTKEQQLEWESELIDLIASKNDLSQVTAFVSEKRNTAQITDDQEANHSKSCDAIEVCDLSEQEDAEDNYIQERLAG